MRHDYQKIIKEELEELIDLERHHRNSIIGSRIRMLRLLKQGQAKSVDEAAHLIGYSWRHAMRWLGSYRQHGLEALLDPPKKRGGKAELMTPAAWDALNEALAGDRIATLQDAREVLAKHGVTYASASSIFTLFKRYKIKNKSGRYRHEKNDPEVLAQAKSPSGNA